MKTLLTCFIGILTIFTKSGILVTFTNAKLQNEDSLSDTAFLINLISTVFAECSSVIVSDQEKLNSNFFTELNRATTSANHFLYDVTFMLEVKNQSDIMKGVNDLHQNRHQCTLVVISIVNIDALNVHQVSEITSTLRGIAGTNKDYFVFHMSVEALKAYLISIEESQEIKYKIGVTLENPVQIVSACFYCFNGGPQLQQRQSPSTAAKQKSDLFPNYLVNFQGKMLRMSTPTECKWLTEIRFEQGSWVPKRGIYNFVILELMKRLNFTLEFFPSMSGGGTGFRFPNGTWIGIVGDLLSRNADLGQAAGQTLSRNEVIEYSFPITYEWLTFTTGVPKPFYSWKAVYRPLSIQVWILLFLSGIFMAAGFLIFLKHQPPNSKQLEKKLVAEFMFRSLVEQGDNILFSPSISVTLKLLSLFWLLFVLVLLTAYKSKLVSFLAFPNVDVPPDTFDALSKSSFKIVLQYTGAAVMLFKTSSNPTYVKIFNRMTTEKSDVKCFEEAINSKAACISWANIVDYVSYKNLSDSHGQTPLVKAPAAAYFLLGGILMRKKSTYRVEISNYIMQAMDSGLLNKWKKLDEEFVSAERKFWRRKSNATMHNSYATSGVSDVLTMKHLSGSFLILACGIVVAICVFAKELYIRHRGKTLIEPVTQHPNENRFYRGIFF